MSELRVCRICLDSNVQMHQISGSEVQDVYEKLTNTQVQNDGTLYFACYLCYCQLTKSQQLVEKSQKSEELLKQISGIHNELNLKSVQSVDRLLYGLANSLMISNTVSLHIPDWHENIKCEGRSESDTYEVMFKDEPEDDCFYANEEWCKVDGKQKFMQDEAKPIENIYGTQSSTIGEENESFPICNGISKQALVNKYYKCNDCGKKYVTKALLMKHSNGHNCNIMNLKTKCLRKEKCVYKGKFKNNETLNKGTHTREKPFKCEYCHNSYSHSSTLKTHIRTHTGEKLFKCVYCNYSCTQEKDLKIHIRKHTGEKPFKCEYCNYSCTQRNSLKRHIRTHAREKPFKCEYCNYSCAKGYRLKIHIRTHTREKPFKCNYCIYSSTTRDKLNSHVRKHTGEKPIKCEYCDYSCTRNNIMKIHVRKHTGEKPFKCEYCSYSSASRGLLKRHLRSHTGDKPFKCEYCNYSCIERGNLNRHIRTHTGEKPFKCEYCYYSFINNSGLKRHISRKHTGEKPFEPLICKMSPNESSLN